MNTKNLFLTVQGSGFKGSEVQTFGDPRSLSPNWVEKLTVLESLEDIETRQP